MNAIVPQFDASTPLRRPTGPTGVIGRATAGCGGSLKRQRFAFLYTAFRSVARTHWSGLLVAAALLHAAANGAPAQTTEGPPAPVEFRRVRILDEQLPELARGDLPIRETEFQQLLTDAARKSRRGGPSGASCVRAEYSARFDNDSLVDGRAKLDVRTSGGGAAIWTWGETNLPIRAPIWESDPTRTALLGLIASGAQAVLVESSGVLAFDWSLHGERTSRDTIAFTLRMPSGAYQALRLDLPSSLLPTCRDALVRRVESDATTTPAARATWLVEWQGERALDLHLTSASSRRAATPTARVRQEALYSIDARGLELQVDLRIDAVAEPLQSLTLAVDRRLRIGAIRLGEKSLVWSRRVGAISKDLDEVVVPAAELSGEDRVIQCSALAPLELGASWSLPTLQPRDLLWLEGEAQVAVHEPIVATRLETRGGRIVGALGSTTERRRTWRVRLQDPDAQLTLSADAAPRRLRIRAGTTLVVDAGNMSARCVAEVTPLHGSAFLLDAELPRAWLVDGVETADGPPVEDYQVLAAGAPGRQLLRIRLRDPLGPGRTLRLVIRARRTPPAPATSVGVDQLRLLRFRDGTGLAQDVVQFVAVNHAANSRARFSGDQTLAWLDPAVLSEADHALLDANASSRIFLADHAADDVEVRFERERPRFRAELETSAVVRGKRLVESYRLRLIPDSSAVDRVPVYFTRARAAPLQWKLDPPEEPAPSYRRLPPTGEATDAGETWEVTLTRPRSSPFTLTAERTSPLEDDVELSLASLPEATEQSGQVHAAAHWGEGRWINRGLRPIGQIPAEDAEAAARRLGVIPGAVTFFEYEPAAGDASGLTHSATLSPTARAWATSEVVRTLVASDGTVRHRCEYQIENVGEDELAWELSGGLRVQRLLVDDIDRTPPTSDSAGPPAVGTDESRRVRCELPQSSRRSVVVLDVVGAHSMSGHLQRLDAPRIMPKFPVLERTWRIGLPREWSVWRVDGAGRVGAIGTIDDEAARLWPPARWNQRLFGLLLRESPVAPARSEDPFESARPGPAAPTAPRLGWHAFELRLAAESDATLRLCRTSTWYAFAWSALLLTTAVVGWGASRRVWLAPATALVAGLAALTSPGLFSVVLGGVFLGALFAPLAALGFRVGRGVPRPGPAAPPRETPPRDGTTLSAAAVSALLLLGLVVMSQDSGTFSVAFAQEEPRSSDLPAAPSPRGAYRVLVPVDEQGERSGEYVHVPREFYRLLRRMAEGSEAAAEATFVTSAEYSATRREGDTPVIDVSADYDVEVRTAGARTFWPFARGRATLVENRVTRGGDTVELDWQAENAGWWTTFAEPGRYRVHLRLHVAAAADATAAELAVPPVARGVVRWRPGAGATPLQFVRESCGPDEPGENGERIVRIGPTSRLRFQWTAANDSPLAAPAEQFYWLHVRPGSVQLDFAFKLPPAAVPASRIVRLRHDPQLRLLPVVASESVVRAQPVPGSSGWLQVELAESDEPLDVRLSFLLSRATGIGRIVVPRLDWPGGRIERRWLGVTVAPSLELSRQEGGALEPLPVPTFLQAWGPTDSLPLVAYRLSPEDESSVLAVRQREPTWTATESTSYTLRRARGELSWQAEVVAEAGPMFQYEVAIAGAPRVTDVTLQEGSEASAKPVRWSVGADGRLRFLADQPLAGTHRILVQADFPLTFDKRTPLPTLTLAGRATNKRTVRIWRNESISLDVAELEDWTAESSTEEADSRAEDAHFIGRWSWTPKAEAAEPAPPTILVRTNRPRSRGRLLTTLVPAGDAWSAAVHGAIQSDRGRLERVRLEAPSDWTGPWTSDDDARWTARSAPGEIRTQLARVVAQESSGPFEFTLRGPLKFARQEHPRAPDILCLDTVAQDRYLALPVVDRGRKITWETSGLRAVVQPDGWLTASLAACLRTSAANEPTTDDAAPSAGVPKEPSARPPEERPARRLDRQGVGPYQFFQIVAPRFVAAVVDVDQESPDARVRHAGHRFYGRASGAGWGRSTFTVLAGGRHDCIVDLPAGARLIYARTSGEYSLVERLDDGGWRIPLVDTYAPQELELTYSLAPRATAAEVAADASGPRIRQWPTENESTYRASPPRRVDADDGRWPAAALLVVGALLAIGLGRWQGWRDYLAVGPALPAVLVAIAWWLWFEPRWFGLLIGLAGLLAANLPSTIRLGTKRGL